MFTIRDLEIGDSFEVIQGSPNEFTKGIKVSAKQTFVLNGPFALSLQNLDIDVVTVIKTGRVATSTPGITRSF